LVFSRTLLSLDWGTSVFTIVPGLVLVTVAAVLRWRWRRHLTMRVLFGAPEVGAGSPGKLLTDGIYARIRHPRYAEVVLAFLGYSLISNYPAAYAATALIAGQIAALIPLEERELAGRFGAPYEEYRRRVPALIPGFGRRRSAGVGPGPM
jgi:protein-S-isoprenylcysteine O-methyltransferase Ste14